MKASRKVRKSALTKRAEKIFEFQQPPNGETLPLSLIPAEPAYVQTFTTYSVGEDPIPDVRKLWQQA